MAASRPARVAGTTATRRGPSFRTARPRPRRRAVPLGSAHTGALVLGLLSSERSVGRVPAPGASRAPCSCLLGRPIHAVRPVSMPLPAPGGIGGANGVGAVGPVTRKAPPASCGRGGGSYVSVASERLEVAAAVRVGRRRGVSSPGSRALSPRWLASGSR